MIGSIFSLIDLAFRCVFHGIFFVCFILILIKIYLLVNINKKKGTDIAFFHPYCNSAGGGEKVLWSMIYGLLESDTNQKKNKIYVYTGDKQTADEILTKARNRFQLDLVQYLNSIVFVRVGARRLLQPFQYFTMGFQIIGTLFYTAFCIIKFQPHVFIDTTGFSFSYLMVKILLPNTKIIAYVHYPFISHDMLDKVVQGENSFNNSQRIADNPTLKKAQIIYYQVLLFMYGCLGRLTDQVFTNSTWTDDHMKKLWTSISPAFRMKLFPPCNIKSLLSLQDRDPNNIIIMSFAQFRPEQFHINQIKIYERVLERVQSKTGFNLQFYMTGSCRSEDDQQLLNSLKQEVKDRNLQGQIEFQVNLDYKNLQKVFKECCIGLHTMEAEHFGIAVVQMMAAGLIVLAHNSAGPQFDIIQDQNHGFLCDTIESYTDNLIKAIDIYQNEAKRQKILQNCRTRAQQFSDQNFIRSSTLVLKSKFQLWKLQ